MAQTATESIQMAATKRANPMPKMWTLWYFKGTSQPQFKHFILDGTMREAMLRGREHCERMMYRFGSVRPFIVDLDYQEEQFAKTAQEFPHDEE